MVKSTSFRLSEPAARQLAWLAKQYGNQTTAVTVAIDRLYTEERSKMITIGRIDTRPELDSYHADTGGESYTAVKIDPQSRHVCVMQEYHDNATPGDEWHRHVLVITPGMRPDEATLRTYLEGAEGQAVLTAICDGHSIEWDGHNMVGRLTQAADNALFALSADLDGLPESDWSLWGVSDWLHDADLDITAETSDAEIERLAAQIEQDATAEQVILYGDLAAYLRECRSNA